MQAALVAHWDLHYRAANMSRNRQGEGGLRQGREKVEDKEKNRV